MDAFTQRRLTKFVADFRARSGTAPSLQDFEHGGFSKELVDEAVRDNLLDMLYVTLTSGSVVKTYRLHQP